MKLYHRTAMWADKKDLMVEIENAKTDPLDKPSTWNGFWKLYSKKVDGYEPIRHEFIEVCGACGKHTRRLVFDRDAIGPQNLLSTSFYYNSIFTTRVRVTKIPNDGPCNIKENWLHKKVPNNWVHLREDFNNTEHLKLKKVDLDWFLKNAMSFAKRYWRYNALFNCQHFATNMYNKMCKRNLDFASSELTGVHSLKSGKTPILDFQLGNDTPIDAKFKHNLKN